MGNQNIVDSHGMVMVMGVTGSGKSTFVNLLKPGAVRVEHGLHSAPEPPQAVKLVLDRRHRRSVTVVDTPGFDDTQRSGSTVLKEILRYLSVQYTLNIPLKGIIYLHQIHETRMRGSATQYLKTLQSLCSGPDALKNVIFVTTRWDMVKNQEDGMRREQELIDDWLSPMLEKGATVMRFHGSPAEAQAMVSRLVSSEESLVLDVQRELVDDEKSISETQLQMDYRCFEHLASADGVRRGASEDMDEKVGLKAKEDVERESGKWKHKFHRSAIGTHIFLGILDIAFTVVSLFAGGVLGLGG